MFVETTKCRKLLMRNVASACGAFPFSLGTASKPRLIHPAHPLLSSHRRFGELDNFRYERASCQNEKTFANTKRVEVPKCGRRWSWQMEEQSPPRDSLLFGPPTEYQQMPKVNLFRVAAIPVDVVGVVCRPRSLFFYVICTAVAANPESG